MAKVGNLQQGYHGKLDGQVFYKGADGATVVRKITIPKNPKTLAQNVQRVITLTVGACYKAMKVIADHSFEGCSMGFQCSNKFRSINARRMRERAIYLQEQGIGLDQYYQFMAKGQTKFVPAAVFISEGTLNQVYAAIDANFKGNVTIGENTYAGVINALGAQRGDQMTFVTVEKDTHGEYIFHYARVILDPRNENGAAPLSTAFVADGAIQNPSSRNSGVIYNLAFADGTLKFSLTQSDAVVACGIIMSRKAGNKWLRSTCKLALNEEAIGSDLRSLLTAANYENIAGSLYLDSEEAYLNNAGQGGSEGSSEAPAPAPTGPVLSTTAKINGANQSISGGSVSVSSLSSVALQGSNLGAATFKMIKGGTTTEVPPTSTSDTTVSWTITGAAVGETYKFYQGDTLKLTVNVINTSGDNGGGLDMG